MVLIGWFRGIGVLDHGMGLGGGNIRGTVWRHGGGTSCPETAPRLEARARSRGNAETSMPRACPAKSGAVCRPVVLLRSRITDEAPPGGRRPRDDAEGHVVTCAERHRAPGLVTCPTRATTRPGRSCVGRGRPCRARRRRARRFWVRLFRDGTARTRRHWAPSKIVTPGHDAGHDGDLPRRRGGSSRKACPGISQVTGNRRPRTCMAMHARPSGADVRVAAEHDHLNTTALDTTKAPVFHVKHGGLLEVVRRSARGPRRSPPGGRAWGAHRSRTSRARRRSRR